MHPFLALILVLLVAGALMAFAAVYLMARGLVRPPRMTDGKALHVLNRLTPRDLDLAYEDVRFEVRQEQTGDILRLAAWWIPGEARGREAEWGRGRAEDLALSSSLPLTLSPNHPLSSSTVILIHGYADAKIGAIAWAPMWHELGFNVLALDLRAHGDSDGELCSGGFHERHDLVAVIHELLARYPGQTQTLILFGASMGAAVAIGAAELLTAENASRPPLVHGVVLDSPFMNFRSASAAHFRRLGLPGGWITQAALRLAERVTAADFAEIDLIRVLPRLHCPLLIVSPEEDVYINDEDAAEIERAMRERPAALGQSRFESYAGVGHLMAAVSDAVRYRQMLQQFAPAVASHVASGPPPASGEAVPAKPV
jgi:alpha-beta hydrolase superfamily lysophospholipase